MRYFSPNVADQLAASPDEHLLAGTRQPAAVLFVDVRGFTAMAESMDPSQLGAFLSELRRRSARPAFEHEGTVDKFIGDGIMAVFGTPRSQPDDARRALACALDMLDVTDRWSKKREKARLPPVRIGIGGHFGEVFAGALKSEELLEYTVIGDTVNIAERLERLTRQLDRPLVVSSALLQGGGEVAASRRWERLEPQHLPGHRRAVEVFALAPAPSGPRTAQKTAR